MKTKAVIASGVVTLAFLAATADFARASFLGDIVRVVAAPVTAPIDLGKAVVTGEPIRPVETLGAAVPVVAMGVEADKATDGAVSDALDKAKNVVLLPVNVAETAANAKDRTEEAETTIKKANDALDAAKQTADAANRLLVMAEDLLSLAKLYAEQSKAFSVPGATPEETQSNKSNYLELMRASIENAHRASELINQLRPVAPQT